MTEDDLRAMTISELMETNLETCESYLLAGHYPLRSVLVSNAFLVLSVSRVMNSLGQPTLNFVTDNGQHSVWGIPERHEATLISQFGSGGLLRDLLELLDSLKAKDSRHGLRWPD